jgi:lysozyme
MINVNKMLSFDEGCKLVVYNCSEGFATCGTGHNLQADPATSILKRPLKVGDKITSLESAQLFEHDLNNVYNSIKKKIPFFNSLPDNYKAVLVNMTFQLGINGVLQFKKMLAAMQLNDNVAVAAAMKNSKWYKQTPNRADRLISTVNGVIPTEYI